MQVGIVGSTRKPKVGMQVHPDKPQLLKAPPPTTPTSGR